MKNIPLACLSIIILKNQYMYSICILSKQNCFYICILFVYYESKIAFNRYWRKKLTLLRNIWTKTQVNCIIFRREATATDDFVHSHYSSDLTARWTAYTARSTCLLNLIEFLKNESFSDYSVLCDVNCLVFIFSFL